MQKQHNLQSDTFTHYNAATYGQPEHFQLSHFKIKTWGLSETYDSSISTKKLFQHFAGLEKLGM